MGLESEYANCKTLYVLPPAGYDTQESNVPVMVRIGRSAGKYRDDTSDVFKKLGASYQKMAVSLDDDVTECPVEVTEWDVKRQLGILFVKIPSVPTTGMTLKLWYDSTHDDNTTNVGAIGSAVGQSVWANGFAGVWHMKNSGGLVLDSTANANHGTIYGAMEVNGPLGRCLLFDGVDDYIDIPYDASLQVTSQMTLTVWLNHSGAHDGYGGLWFDNRTITTNRILVNNHGMVRSEIVIGDVGGYRYSVERISAGVWGSFDASYDGAAYIHWFNGVADVPFSASGDIDSPTGTSRWIGRGYSDTYWYGGMIAFESLSSVARSPAWIALTNASLKDELIAFSTPGTEPLTGNERMRLKPDGTLIANEFVEV